MRLFIFVEGQTEEAFVKSVLAPHLMPLQVLAIIVETSRDRHGRKRRGGGSWGRWLRDIRRVTGEQDGRFSTMFDLYGLPSDFPELDSCRGIADTNRRVDVLQKAMAGTVDDWRFIPYIQRHEFEALVLAALDPLTGLLEGDDLAGLSALRGALGETPPEDVNDGRETAPSKRLEGSIPSYRKTLHGPLALESASLPLLRRRCPRFDAWVSTLEKIGNP